MQNRICLLIAMLGLTFSIQCGSDARSEETGPNNNSSCECVKKAFFEFTYEGEEIVFEGPWKMSDGPVTQLRCFEPVHPSHVHFRGKWSLILRDNTISDWFTMTDGAITFIEGANGNIGMTCQIVVLY